MSRKSKKNKNNRNKKNQNIKTESQSERQKFAVNAFRRVADKADGRYNAHSSQRLPILVASIGIPVGLTATFFDVATAEGATASVISFVAFFLAGKHASHKVVKEMAIERQVKKSAEKNAQKILQTGKLSENIEKEALYDCLRDKAQKTISSKMIQESDLTKSFRASIAFSIILAIGYNFWQRSKGTQEDKQKDQTEQILAPVKSEEEWELFINPAGGEGDQGFDWRGIQAPYRPFVDQELTDQRP